ncbi:hypothetical protein [Streptomyces caelestis]
MSHIRKVPFAPPTARGLSSDEKASALTASGSPWDSVPEVPVSAPAR